MIRQTLQTFEEIKAWYDAKFTEMKGVWKTPDSEWVGHLLRMRAKNKMTVLDLGCGDGSFLRMADKWGMKGVGVDISAVALEFGLAKTDNQALVFLPIAAEAIGPDSTFFQDESYDRIVSLGSLEHFLDIPKVLASVRRMLKPDGLWYFQVPNDKWTAVDQPNELAMETDAWIELFKFNGLTWTGAEESGDNSFIWGKR